MVEQITNKKWSMLLAGWHELGIFVLCFCVGARRHLVLGFRDFFDSQSSEVHILHAWLSGFSVLEILE
jgi:hypothetical protein